jgi:hypothetical protein
MSDSEEPSGMALFMMLGGVAGAFVGIRMARVGIVEGAVQSLRDLLGLITVAAPPILGFMIGSAIVMLLYVAGRKVWGGVSA